MFEILKKMILNNSQPKEEILKKMEVFKKTNRLTEEEYTQLLELMG